MREKEESEWCGCVSVRDSLCLIVILDYSLIQICVKMKLSHTGDLRDKCRQFHIHYDALKLPLAT